MACHVRSQRAGPRLVGPTIALPWPLCVMSAGLAPVPSPSRRIGRATCLAGLTIGLGNFCLRLRLLETELAPVPWSHVAPDRSDNRNTPTKPALTPRLHSMTFVGLSFEVESDGAPEVPARGWLPRARARVEQFSIGPKRRQPLRSEHRTPRRGDATGHCHCHRSAAPLLRQSGGAEQRSGVSAELASRVLGVLASRRLGAAAEPVSRCPHVSASRCLGVSGVCLGVTPDHGVRGVSRAQPSPALHPRANCSKNEARYFPARSVSYS